ncbi:phage tail tape measure protein [Magnetococcales bacterium HHB-1]
MSRQHKFSIRLAVSNGGRVRAELMQTGEAGDAAFKKIHFGATRASSALESLTARAEMLSQQLGAFDAVTDLLAQLGGIKEGLLQLLQAYGDFEQALVGVGKTADLSGQALEDMGGDIESLSHRVPVAAVELLKIGQTAAQLGVKGRKNILVFTETIARMQSASNLAGEEGATVLARLLNATNEATDSVGTLGSVIVRLGNNSAATEIEIALIANEVARATNTFNVSSARASSLAAVMAELGIQAELGGSEVGKAFRSIDDALRNGGEKLEKLQKFTGQTPEQLRSAFKVDATGVFKDFLRGVDEFKKAGGDVVRLLETFELTGEQALKVIPVMASRTDKLTRAIQMANDELQNTTALQKESDKAFATYNSQVQILANTFESIAVAAGKEVAPAVGEMAVGLSHLLSDSEKVIEVLKDIGIVLSTVLIARFAGAVTSTIAFRHAMVGLLMLIRVAPTYLKSTAAGLLSVGTAARTGAAGLGVLRGAMGMLGGPVGTLITAIGTLYMLFPEGEKKHKAIAEAADQHTDAIKQLREASGHYIDTINEEKKALQEKARAYGEVRLEAELAQQAEYQSQQKKTLRASGLSHTDVEMVMSGNLQPEQADMSRLVEETSLRFKLLNNRISASRKRATELRKELARLRNTAAKKVSPSSAALMGAEDKALGKMLEEAKLIAQTVKAPAEKLAEERARLNELFKAGAFKKFGGEETYRRALAALKAKHRTPKSSSSGKSQSQQDEQADNGVLKSLEQEIKLLGMSDRQRQITLATRRLSAQATLGQREEVKRLAGVLFDEQKAIESRNKAEEKQLELKRQGEELKRRFQTPRERYESGVASLQGLREQEHIDPKTYVRAKAELDNSLLDQSTHWVDGAKRAFRDYVNEGENAAQTTKRAFGTALQGMEDGLTEFVMTGKFSFGNFTNAILSDLARIAVRRAIVAPLAEGFNSILKGISPSPGSGNVTANAHGNVISNGRVVPFAKGGIVTMPTYFPMHNGAGLMGEAGEEAIVPLSRMANGNLGVQGVPSNVQVNIVVENNAGPNVQASARSERDGNGNQMIRILVEQVEHTMGANIARGEGIAPLLESQYGISRARGGY